MIARACSPLSRLIALTVTVLLLVITPTNYLAGESPKTPHRAGERLKVPNVQKYGPAISEELDGAFWRTDAGFQATIRISNIVQTSAIKVTPVLFMADGTEFTLPAVDLRPAGVATVNVNDAMLHAPDSVTKHLSSFGSAALRFQWPWASAITATIRSVDVPRSLTYSNPFQPSMAANARLLERRSKAKKGQAAALKAADLSPQNVTLEGLWWKRDPADSGFVALTNRSSVEVRARVKVLAGTNDQKLQTEVLVGPHQTQQVSLKEMFASLPNSAQSGGIRVQYEGVQGSITITGGMENVAAGYSARIPFLYAPGANSKVSSWGLASVGIMHGPPDPMMQFPADVSFTAYAVFRNISVQTMQVTPKLLVTPGRQASAPEIKAQTLSLPPLTINPGETTRLDLDSALSGSGFKDATANLTLSVSARGVPGGLLAAIGSVDQGGSYVFEVEPHPVSSSLSKNICFFEVGNGEDTMVSLWNHSAQDEDLLVTLFFDGGHYKLPVHLAAQQSAMFNVLEIIKARTPDAEGNVIPQSVQRGSMRVSGPQDETQRIDVSLNASTFSVRDATCDPGCQQCEGYTGMYMEPDSLSLGVGQSVTVDAMGNYSTGGQYYMDATYSSLNTAVATVSGNTVTAVRAGSTDILADSFSPVNTNVCPGELDSNGNPMSCPESEDMEAECPVADRPVISSLTPNSKVVGASNLSITIQGSGFGTSPTVNLPSGMSSVDQTNDSNAQITKKVNISFTPTIGSTGNFTVTAYGQTSDPAPFTFDGPFEMVVQSDTVVSDSSGAGNLARLVTYKVQNFGGTLAGSIPIAESFSGSNMSCNQAFAPITVQCDGLTATDSTGQFQDQWQLLNFFTPAGCGFDIVDNWQWCSSSGGANPTTGITFGHLLGFAHTDKIRINGFDDPVPIPLSPNPMPTGTVIANH